MTRTRSSRGLSTPIGTAPGSRPSSAAACSRGCPELGGNTSVCTLTATTIAAGSAKARPVSAPSQPGPDRRAADGGSHAVTPCQPRSRSAAARRGLRRGRAVVTETMLLNSSARSRATHARRPPSALNQDAIAAQQRLQDPELLRCRDSSRRGGWLVPSTASSCEVAAARDTAAPTARAATAPRHASDRLANTNSLNKVRRPHQFEPVTRSSTPAAAVGMRIRARSRQSSARGLGHRARRTGRGRAPMTSWAVCSAASSAALPSFTASTASPA